MDVDNIINRVARILNMPVDEIWLPGKYKRLVTATRLDRLLGGTGFAEKHDGRGPPVQYFYRSRRESSETGR